MKQFTVKVSAEAGERVDKFLADVFSGLSRSKIQAAIKKGEVLVNGEKTKSAYKLVESDLLEAKIEDERPLFLEKVDMEIEILYEDNNLLVVDKPAGVVVHPTEEGGHLGETVVNAFLDRFNEELLIGGNIRPGVVHRLDKDTSGVLLLAKNKTALDYFQTQFKKRSVEKRYLTLVYGVFDTEQAIIEAPIARSVIDRKKMAVAPVKKGKYAKTVLQLKEKYRFEKADYSYLEVKIETGRTHQIRVHMASVEHPVVGDEVYGTKRINNLFKRELGLERQFLHAHSLVFENIDGKKIKIKSALAADLKDVLDQLAVL